MTMKTIEEIKIEEVSEQSTVKKYRPQLFIDQKELDDKQVTDLMYKEISQYSITPRTFESRTFKSNFSFSPLLEKATKDDQEHNEQLLKLEDLSRKHNELLDSLGEDGIFSKGEIDGCRNKPQPFSDLLNTKKQKINQQQKKLGLFIEVCNELPKTEKYLFYEDKYSNEQGNSVSRYGINITQGLQNIIKDYNTNLNYHFKVLDNKSFVSSNKFFKQKF